MLTKEWAELHDISTNLTPPPITGYDEPCRKTVREIAMRILILQGVVAVAAQVDPVPIVDWFHGQGLWGHVTTRERAFLADPAPSEQEQANFFWRKEAEWALLWAIGKVEYLGLPTTPCDSARLVDEIIPTLGSDIDDFVISGQLRPVGLLLAEDERTYDMWCCAQPARRNGELPEDLSWDVLYERRYAFEWLYGIEDWDEVTCDA